MRDRTKILERLGVKITKNDIEEYSNKKAKMLERGNPYEINNWVKSTFGISAYEMIDAIIKTGDILQIYEFFYMIVDLKTKFGSYKKLEDLGINNEKLEKLQEVILQSKNAKLIRYCIGFVPGINLDRYLQALYSTKSLWDIKELTQGEEYINLDEVANPELLEKVKSPTYFNALEEAEECAKRGEYFPHSLETYRESKKNISILTEKIVNTQDPYLICELANYIEHLENIKDEEKTSLVEKLAKAEITAGDSMGMYEFLSSVGNVSQVMFKKMVRKIIENGDEKYMRYTQEFTPYKERIEGKPIELALRIEKEKRKRGEER